MAVWGIGGLSLVIAYGMFSQRYYRARAARLGDQSTPPSNPLTILGTAFSQGMSLWSRQTDPELERLRKRATRTFLAFVLFGFLGGPVLMNLAALLPHIDLPSVSLPSLANTEGGSAMRWAALLGFGGYALLMGWQLVVALRNGPDWVSGRPGDPMRLPRRWMILMCVFGIAMAAVLLPVAWISSAR